MCGSVEFGKCEVCGKEAPLQRTYWHYNVKCECHSPSHWEMKRHCVDCIPEEPVVTNITLKTESLEKTKSHLFTDKEIEKYIWEEISIPLSQIDIDTNSDGYIQYLNAVHWAKWGRDNCNQFNQSNNLKNDNRLK